MALKAGLTAEVTREVTEELTARRTGSGSVNGLATPHMVALMEAAAVEAVAPELDEGWSSVGTALAIAHSAPTPVGMQITARAVLTAVIGRQLVFEVFASDEAGEIGRGTHERFVVELEPFERKIAARGGS